MPPTAPITVDDIELGTNEFWSLPLDERAAAFAALRERCPLSFHQELQTLEGMETGPGFWSVVTYEDIRSVSRRPWIFSSTQGITLNEQAPETLEFFGSMIVLDDPRHAKLRQLVQKGFTPRTVGAAWRRACATRARRLVHDAAELGECDFVNQFAAPLPLQVICDMLGVPPSDEKQIFEWTNIILGAGDPEFGGTLEVLFNAALGMYEYAQAARAMTGSPHPRDDLTSILMHAEVEGQRLTTSEFGSFFILLAVAGNETTRNAISWGMKLLTDHPDQRRRVAGRPGPGPQRDRGDRALGQPGDPHAPDRQRGHRDRRPADRRRRQGRAVVLVGATGTRRSSTTGTTSTSPAVMRKSRWATAPAARTSASAPTSPAGRSR